MQLLQQQLRVSQIRCASKISRFAKLPAVTTTATTTLEATPTYYLRWERDNCGYSYPHIDDVALQGSEEEVVNKCANICTSKHLA